MRSWSKGLSILELSLYKLGKVEGTCRGVCVAWITGVATPPSSNLELAGTGSILQQGSGPEKKREARWGEGKRTPLKEGEEGGRARPQGVVARAQGV